MKVGRVRRNHHRGDSSAGGRKIAARTTGRETKALPLRGYSRYYIAFIARQRQNIAVDSSLKALSRREVVHVDFTWHAFVQWIEVDSAHKMTRAEAFGFYPMSEAGAITLGVVPGTLKNEYLQKDGVAGDVVLRVEITEAEYRKTLSVKDDWARRAAAGEFKYNLLGNSCIDFVDKIARALGSSSPPIEVPQQEIDSSESAPLTLKRSLRENYDNLIDRTVKTIQNLTYATRTPQSYVSELFRLNHAHHVPAKALARIQ
jgi:hypothetical protein